MSKKEEKDQESVENITIPQLMSDQTFLTKGIFDMRVLANISKLEQAGYSWFLEIPPYRGGNFARKWALGNLYLSRSVDGWGSNQAIRGVQGSKGVPNTNYAKKPGLIGQHFTNKNWKEKAQMEGKEVVE